MQMSLHLTYVTETNPATHRPEDQIGMKYLHSSSYGIQCDTLCFFLVRFKTGLAYILLITISDFPSGVLFKLVNGSPF